VQKGIQYDLYRRDKGCKTLMPLQYAKIHNLIWKRKIH